jgi:DNA-binding NarL/FixJ family response regulator
MPHLTAKTRVLVADDHSLVAAGLRSMLEPTYDVIGVVENGRALVQAARQLEPDVILLDISMPELNGIEAARQLRKCLPSARLIFVTMHTDATVVAEALRAGCSGYVVKRSAPRELITAIEEVVQGRTYLTPYVTKDLMDEALAAHRPFDSFGRLSPRQREVLQLLAEGRSNKEIAATLGISQKTVEYHRAGIVRELGLSTTADLVKYALRHGLASA